MLDAETIEILMEGCIRAAWRREDGIRRPYVAAIVLSRDERLLSMGIKRFIEGTQGLLIHAERDALMQAGDQAKGGTLITTLEPCVRIPEIIPIFKPCAELIKEMGIQKVIIGIRDNSLYINGRGIVYLKKEGIQVEMYKGETMVLEKLASMYKK